MPPSPGSSRTRLPVFLSAARRVSSAAGGLILASGARCAFASGADLGAVDEQLGLAGDRHDGEGQRHGIVRHVRAADVEQPGNRIGQRQHHRVLAVLAQRRLQLADLLLGRLAGILQRVRDDRDPWAAPDAPCPTRDRPDCCASGFSLMPLLADRLGQLLDGARPNAARDRSRPRRRPPACAPATRTAWRPGISRISNMPSVDLGARLHRVAAVDEQRRRVARDHGQTGRAGEARQPRQPLGGGRRRTRPVLVGARHQHGVEAALGHQIAQPCHALGRGRRPPADYRRSGTWRPS